MLFDSTLNTARLQIGYDCNMLMKLDDDRIYVAGLDLPMTKAGSFDVTKHLLALLYLTSALPPPLLLLFSTIIIELFFPISSQCMTRFYTQYTIKS